MDTSGPWPSPGLLERLPRTGQWLQVVRAYYRYDVNVWLLYAHANGDLWEVIVCRADPVIPELGTLFWVEAPGTPGEDNLGTWLLIQHETRFAVCVLLCAGYHMVR